MVDGGTRNVNMDGAALVVAQPIMTYFFIFYKLLAPDNKSVLSYLLADRADKFK